jgi:hypothetical protein
MASERYGSYGTVKMAASPIFDGESYDLWAMKLGAYLDVVEDDYDVSLLPEDSTVAKTNQEGKDKNLFVYKCLRNHHY